MNHASDDDLLDLALSGRGERAELAAHVDACPECAPRFEAVRAEQEMFRQKFAQVSPPVHLETRITAGRPIRNWMVAALFVAALGLGALCYRAVWGSHPRRDDESPAQGTRRNPHPMVSMRRIARQMDSMIEKISEARENLFEPAPEPVAKAYVQLLSEVEVRYAELLEAYCAMTCPLTGEQREDLRRKLAEFQTRADKERDRDKLAADFHSALSSILTEEQYGVLEEYRRQEADLAWEKDIDVLVEDLADRMNLRFSETEQIRQLLTERYPKSELSMMPVWECPPDLLLNDPILAQEVRKILQAEHWSAFNDYLENSGKARDRARQLAVSYRNQ